MPARKPAGEKTKRLNVYLLKPEVQNFDDALQSPVAWQGVGLAMTIDGRSCMLYAKSKPGRKADWVTMLEGGLQGQATPFQNANSWNHSALLLIEVKDRFYAVAFGYGATFLKRDCWEPRFGLKVALNLADEANLQQAAFKTHEGKTMSREVSSSRLTGFYDFGFDSEKDFLRKLTAKLKKDHSLGLRITGKDSVSLVCPAKLDDLPTKCRQLRVESWRKKYKKHFPDIENVIPVDDKTIIAGLVAELDLAFAAPNAPAIHFSIPDIIDYDRYAGLRIADNPNLIDDLTVATIQAELGGNPLTYASINFQPVSGDILIEGLVDGNRRKMQGSNNNALEERLEDYIVRVLMDFPDVDYDQHSELLYKLAAQAIAKVRSYLSKAEDVENVLRHHHRQIADLIHAQMQEHFWEESVGYEAKVTKGFETLRSNSFDGSKSDKARDFKAPLENASQIRSMYFSGFAKCLYPVQQFQSDAERRLAVVLENDAAVQKWFKPAPNQFPVYLKNGRYEPDFVVETTNAKLVVEVKQDEKIKDEEVLTKAKAAKEWCCYASKHESEHGGKEWIYLLLPDTGITLMSTIQGLTASYRG